MNDNTVRDIAVMLANQQYTGTAWLDEDVWQEELTDDERDDHMVTARAIVKHFESNP